MNSHGPQNIQPEGREGEVPREDQSQPGKLAAGAGGIKGQASHNAAPVLGNNSTRKARGRSVRCEIQLNDINKINFWKKIDKNGPVMPGMASPCWIWNAYKRPNGYGWFQLSGSGYLAHRIAFVLAGGIFPDDKPQCLHRCDNPACCNPAHLFAGDDQDNMTDRDNKGRGARLRGDANGARLHPETRARGEKHGNAKLTDAQCDYIRSSPMTQVALGRELGVSQVTIGNIRRGATRRPITITQRDP